MGTPPERGDGIEHREQGGNPKRTQLEFLGDAFRFKYYWNYCAVNRST